VEPTAVNRDIRRYNLHTMEKVLSSVVDPWHFGADPDPDLWLMDPVPHPDPTPDPTPFFIDCKDSKKTYFFHIFFL
jgi:hypothetical protein